MRKTRTGSFHRIDEKHHLEIRLAGEEQPYPTIVKSGNNQSIPLDEPRILFRGRDRLALPMLKYYRELCVQDGCTEYQLRSMDVMIKEFEEFAADPANTAMKQPGITKGA